MVVIPGFRGFNHAEMLRSLRAERPMVEHVFVVRGAPAADMHSFTVLTDRAWESLEGRPTLPGCDPNRVHEVVFTSGTTGEPKGVMHTPNTTLSTIYSLIDRLQFSPDDVILMASTLGHQTGYLYSYCLNFLLGATAVWMDVWSPAEAARLIETERVTFTMGATPFLQDLTYVPTPHDLSSLRVFVSAGAPIPRPSRRRGRLGCYLDWMGHRERPPATGSIRGQDRRDGRLRSRAWLCACSTTPATMCRRCRGRSHVTGPAQFVGISNALSSPRSPHPTAGSRPGTEPRDRDGYLAITGRSKT